jgi:hypothetical protein
MLSRYPDAKRWADELTGEIKSGKFQSASENWLSGMDLEDPVSTALAWAREGNSYVCTNGELRSHLLLPIFGWLWGHARCSSQATC